MLNKFLFILLASLLVSCAGTAVFDTSQVDQSLTPNSVIAEPELSRDRIALWGGTILDTQNLQHSTQIEVLAYPLNSSHRPLLEKPPLGRFIILQQGFLEPASYAQGRLLTVLGSVEENQSGSVGESRYIYPVIYAQQLQLWSLQKNRSRTNFSVGVGIRL